MLKLSIIVPVYNVGPYLIKCLDSIINQSFRDFELIIIDDFSTDNSRRIIAEYAAKDGRIKTIFQEENRGVAAARNAGLETAQGEWLSFVDSDDWLEPEMYEQMLKRQVETGADIVECDLIHRITNDRDYRELINPPDQFNLKKSGINEYFFNLYKRQSGMYIFNKIYRRSLIKENKIYFEDNRQMQMEDLLFLFCLSHHIKLIAIVNQPYYNYLHRVGSLGRHKIKDLLEKTTALTNYYIKTAGGGDWKKIPSSLALIIATLIKYLLCHTIIWGKNPVKNGTEILRRAARIIIIKKLLASALINRRTKSTDRILLLLFFLKLYFPASLLYYIFRMLKNGTSQERWKKL